MEEIWRDIKDYEGFYKISNLGNVKSLYRKGNLNEKILKPFNRVGNYRSVMLFKDNKGKNYSVHRLVAETFIDNPNNLPCVNHKDENPSNNNLNNLEWCTHLYNVNYGDCQRKKRMAAFKNRFPYVKVYKLTPEELLKYTS